MKFTAGLQSQCFLCTVGVQLFCWICSVKLLKIGSGEFMNHFVLVLFWFSFVSAVWESKSQILFPPFSRMLVCLINIFKGLLVLSQYPQFCSDSVHLWSCTTVVMMMAPFDSWDYDFLGENDGCEPWEGFACHIPPPPSNASGRKKNERKRKSLENHRRLV